MNAKPAKSDSDRQSVNLRMPVALYKLIKKQAKLERRSISGQAEILLLKGIKHHAKDHGFDPVPSIN